MKNLIDYILVNTLPSRPSREERPDSARLVFMDVSIAPGKYPDADWLRKLVQENRRGEFKDANPLDGQEWSYIELGAWIGDQGLALRLMGLGAILGLWDLRTPHTMLGRGAPPDVVQHLAGMGMVCVKSK